ncbi:2,3,4,5-tetrahydropyridine-2,6-dicarboxylate N-acetyltransferase [Symmachiella macrocystis]|uniref:2,3,4,5-tetrahydropyridine-2,6-dicarboxylate N-acetyltransferase n=1 Tax=Symmachiella macrocystis TaxID=2527985 RepID=A0A5C6BFD8_9PLAN|nr:gamma carbonic anhydrase family protein [Symmachiella macrocystis]TWU09194.1 2,3,4,5-tetrahydropyridine-2,6-dicarboxylate N-acetyltransferase [Symmachiella macrocystis]
MLSDFTMVADTFADFSSTTILDSMSTPQSDADWPSGPLPPEPPIPFPDVHYHWDALHAAPRIDETAWIAPGAVVMGRVRMKARSSVWYNCVLRGDNEYIELGEDTNVQDGSVLHIDPDYPCILGDRVTVGHMAIVHASVVGDGALIAIGAKVLSRCVIGEGALIAAGAVVLEGTQVPPHTLWAGCPARQIKELDENQRARLARTYQHYVNNTAIHLARFGRAHIDAIINGEGI